MFSQCNNYGTYLSVRPHTPTCSHPNSAFSRPNCSTMWAMVVLMFTRCDLCSEKSTCFNSYIMKILFAIWGRKQVRKICIFLWNMSPGVHCGHSYGSFDASKKLPSVHSRSRSLLVWSTSTAIILFTEVLPLSHRWYVPISFALDVLPACASNGCPSCFHHDDHIFRY